MAGKVGPSDGREQSELPRATRFLRDAFATEQECLAAQLRSSRRITHFGDRGEVNEAYFIDFLRKYLPNRYTVEKAIVVDSRGEVSDSIDVVVFDRQYTPTLLDSDKHRYVPAEAVYAVFECKPTLNKSYLDYAASKAESVRRLHRTSVDIREAKGMTSAKEPLPIVAGILAIDVDWVEGFGGRPFVEAWEGLTGDRRIDCGLAVSGACFDNFEETGVTSFGPSANALAYFAFRLLGKLQSLGTVPAVDWRAYATRLGEGNE